MGSVAEGNVLLITMSETLMAVLIDTLVEGGGLEAVGKCVMGLEIAGKGREEGAHENQGS